MSGDTYVVQWVCINGVFHHIANMISEKGIVKSTCLDGVPVVNKQTDLSGLVELSKPNYVDDNKEIRRGIEIDGKFYKPKPKADGEIRMHTKCVLCGVEWDEPAFTNVCYGCDE